MKEQADYRRRWVLVVIGTLAIIAIIGIAEDKHPGWILRYKEILGIVFGFAGVIAAAAIGLDGIRRQTALNARYAQDRDYRLRSTEARGLAGALSAEFAGAAARIAILIDRLGKPKYRPSVAAVRSARLPRTPVLDSNLEKLGLLNTDPTTGAPKITALPAYVVMSQQVIEQNRDFISHWFEHEWQGVTQVAPDQIIYLIRHLEITRRYADRAALALDAFARGELTPSYANLELPEDDWLPEEWDR